ncbi:MAG: Na-translocating system protein MpsC family protein [Thermoguttaceae bacterium]|jgi:uncharacterized protein YbcI
MEKLDSTVAHQIAQAVSDFEQRRTGRLPKSVTVVLDQNTLLITLHGALSPAEKALATSPAGAAEVQDFHRQLFNNSADSLRQEIRRIAGLELGKANVELGFEVGADIPVDRWEMRERSPSGGWPSEVEKVRERQMRIRANKKRQFVHEQHDALEEKRSAVSKLRKAKRKAKGKAEELAKAIQRRPAERKAAATLKAKRGAAQKKEQANYQKTQARGAARLGGRSKQIHAELQGTLEE